MKDYIPVPVDASKVELPENICAISELLAKNAHDVWAKKRMEEGWRYGPARDDARKTHPCLVPYEELPEAEKEYDRQTSLQTLSVLLAMGYTIEKA